uniref:FYVE-type domain-containing protein n=1 Tax=Magallana gigas TaxID=29159 RepID=A0A8W8LRH1_MAGGI|nr:early endosome antigen 1 isoform X2 [Crassostrea gigas]
MFKRLLNRKDEKASSQGVSSQIDEAQGFVCPICMISLQSAEGLQQHFEDAHDENKQHQGEGFLCPICKISLSSPEELQAHFDSKHDDKSVATENRDGDVLAMRQEIDDLKTSLKEERWYTGELKKELEKIPSEGGTKAIPLSIQERSELEMMRLQLKGSEESRTLLSAEVHHLQSKISEISSKLENETMEKEKLLNNFEKLNSEWIAIKARSNELEGQRGAHEDHILTLKQQVEQKDDKIKSLEIQLNQRPGTEDVLVLKQELISVQKLMDNMTLEKENEMRELERKMTDLEDKHKKELKKIRELEYQLEGAPNLEEILSLKTTVSEKSKHIEKLLAEIKEKDTKISCMVQENIKMQSAMETKNSQIADLELQLSTVTNHYQTECTTSDELKTNLREKIQLLEEEARRASVKEQRLTEMESRQHLLVAEIDRLGMERTDLIAKIDAGEGTETVINQLKHEKTLLQNKISQLEHSLDEQKSDSEHKIENLHRELNEVKGELQTTGDLLHKQKSAFEEKAEKLHTVQLKLHQLEIESKSKIEQLTTAEEAVICERNEIQNQFKNIEKSLEEKSTELRKLQKQLEQKNREAAIEREKNATLETETRKQLEKEASSQERFKALEQKLKEKILDFENITAQVKDLEIQILSEKRHSTEVKERMADLEQEKNSKYEEAILVKERNHALEKAIEEQREKGTMMTQHIELLEHQLKQKALEFEKISTEAKDLWEQVTNLKKYNSEMKQKTAEQELQLNSLSSLVTTKKELENVIEKTKCELTVVRENLAQQEEINELKTKELQSLIQEKVLESEKLLKAKLELQEKFDATLLEVDGLRSEKAELIIKNEEMQRTLANSKEKETVLNRSFDELREIRNEMNTQMIQLDKDMSEYKEKSEKYQKEKECLEIEVEVLRKKIEEDKSTKDSYEKEVENLNATLLKERLEREQEFQSLEEAKELLINQKIKLASQLEELNVQFQQVKQENSEDTKALKSLQQSLKEENSKLQTKLMSTNEELENLKRQTDEEKAKFEVELSVLNENLTTIRGDLVSNLAALEEANKLNDQLMGGKLEMEAKLENNNDERRILLERCLTSEEKCENLRQESIDLRRKLDDTQAALQELGRENQSLQITTTKVSSRKWADDNEVKECMGCNKSFSVTVRKHHCRNCGNIYCNDCSAKEAKLVSSKKPVRVCDGCFIEIGKM